MLRRWVRIVVAFATALAAWVVATPAFAAAPLCDDRGATTFAPAPQLQSPETSIDVGDAPEDDCLGMGLLHGLHEGRAPSQLQGPTALQDMVLPDPLRVPPAGAVSAIDARDALVRAPAGVRGRVDRPPRA